MAKEESYKKFISSSKTVYAFGMRVFRCCWAFQNGI